MLTLKNNPAYLAFREKIAEQIVASTNALRGATPETLQHQQGYIEGMEFVHDYIFSVDEEQTDG